MTGRRVADLIRRYGEPVTASVAGEVHTFDAVIRPISSQDGQFTPAGFLEDCRYVMYAPPRAGQTLRPGDCITGKTGQWMVRRIQPDGMRGEVVCVRVALSAVRSEPEWQAAGATEPDRDTAGEDPAWPAPERDAAEGDISGSGTSAGGTFEWYATEGRKDAAGQSDAFEPQYSRLFGRHLRSVEAGGAL